MTTTARPGAHGSDPSSDRRTRVAVAGIMANGVAALTLVYFVQPLLPALAQRFTVSAAQASLALSVTTFSLVSGLLFVAPLADRFGSERLLRWSLTAATVLAAACAAASDWGVLLALRALLGVCLAAPLALPMSILRRLAPARYPALAGGYIAATGLGTALARLAPLPAFDLGGWSLVAAGAAGLAAVSTASVWMIRGHESPHSPTVSWVRGMLLPARALGDGVIALICVASFASMGAFVGLFNAMGFRISAPDFGVGSSATLVYALYPLAIAGPLLAGVWRARRGRTAAAIVCIGIMIAGTLSSALPGLPASAVALGTLTFGFLGLNSLTAAWVVERAHASLRPTVGASSAYLAAYYAGSGVWGFVSVQVWSAAGWVASVSLSCALVCTAAVAIIAASRRDRRNGHGATRPTSLTEG